MRRVAAGAIDVVLSMIGAVVLIALGAAAGLGLAELEVPLLLYGAYHALFYWLWDGQTPGLAILDIRVVSANGGELLAAQAMLRGLLRPLALYALGWSAWLGAHEPGVVAVSVATLLLVELGMMFTLPSRQTLSDLVSRTLVVDAPPPQPHRAPAAPMYSETDAEFGVRPQQVR
jgi:uncharacterized RDD family membrane protein YckC